MPRACSSKRGSTFQLVASFFTFQNKYRYVLAPNYKVTLGVGGPPSTCDLIVQHCFRAAGHFCAFPAEKAPILTVLASYMQEVKGQGQKQYGFAETMARKTEEDLTILWEIFSEPKKEPEKTVEKSLCAKNLQTSRNRDSDNFQGLTWPARLALVTS